MKLLCLCDSPTLQTGFARVAKNLIKRWHAAKVFDEICVWGVGYSGFPHSIEFLSNHIFPASSYENREWYHPHNLTRFLNLLETDVGIGENPGGFTHLWIMQDTFLLWPMAQALKKLCSKRDVRTSLYFPVDAPLDPRWVEIVEAVDVPVAYCEYGRAQAAAALGKTILNEKGEPDKAHQKERFRAIDRIKMLPHGVETDVYRPLLDPKTKKPIKPGLRQQIFNGRVLDSDFVLLNVSQHQKRKGIAQSMTVLKSLKRQFREKRWRLYLHMPSKNEGEQTDLRLVAEQLGLVNGEDVFYGDTSFSQGHPTISEAHLNAVYNACDMLLTTSYGEGWGLPITEAMAAGLPVAGPRHTSIEELMADDRGILFNTLGSDVIAFDNSRLRLRSDVDDAAMKIGTSVSPGVLVRGGFNRPEAYSARALDWARSDFLSWDRIAAEWLKLLVEG